MFSFYISEVDFGISWYLHIMEYAYKKVPEECTDLAITSATPSIVI